MSQIIMVYVTMSSHEKANEIVQILLEKKIIVCATMFPCNSIYLWKNKIENDREIIVLLKTLDSKFQDLKKNLENIHPYEIPCILKINVQANDSYINWALNQIGE